MIIELLDGRGRVIHRHRLTGEPITVGRAYDCDMIVDDPYLDPHHLRITPLPEGGYQFVDADSTNGTWDVRLGWRVHSGLARTGLELRAGRTHLRFAAIDTPVAATLPDPALKRGLERYLLEPRLALMVIALGLGLTGLNAYFDSSGSHFQAVSFLTPGLIVLVVGAIWAGAWAFANRLVTHRFRFVAHLALVALVGTAALAIRIGIQWIQFFDPEINGVWLTWPADLLMLGTLLAGHLWIVTEWGAARRWRVAAAATVLVAAVVWLLASDQIVNSDDAAPAANQVLKPLSAKLVPARSADDFFKRSKDLKKEVDDLSEE